MINYPNIIEKCFNGIHYTSLGDSMFNNRKICLNEAVTVDSVNTLKYQLLYLDSIDHEKPIEFYIDTPGGDCIAGFSLYDVIRNISAPVVTINMGQCASIGSILFLAGDKRCMLPHASVLIHEPSTDMGTVQITSAEKRLELLNKMNDRLVEIITERTGKDADTVLKLIKEETYFDYDEAVNFGFVNTDYGFVFNGGK